MPLFKVWSEDKLNKKFVVGENFAEPVSTQAAQTLFAIYIRDSIALRLNHLRECMKMVRNSL